MTIYELLFCGFMVYGVMSALFITLRHWRNGLQAEQSTPSLENGTIS
jgi:hypothetical protein